MNMNPFKRYGEAKSELRRVLQRTREERIFQEKIDHITKAVTVADLKQFYTFMHNQPDRKHYVIPGVGFAYEIKT